MKDEYDFSQGKRGQFYQPDSVLNIPIYLDQDVERWFAKKAKSKGVDMQQMINEWLRKDISLLKTR